MVKNIKDPIVTRLDALIALQMEILRNNTEIGRGQMYKAIHDVGLTPTEIGEMVGITGNDVSAYIVKYETTLKSKKNRKGSKSGDNKN